MPSTQLSLVALAVDRIRISLLLPLPIDELSPPIRPRTLVDVL